MIDTICANLKNKTTEYAEKHGVFDTKTIFNLRETLCPPWLKIVNFAPTVIDTFSVFIILKVPKRYNLAPVVAFKIPNFTGGKEKMKVKPLADRVMVRLDKNEAKTAGGIIIPDTAQEKTQQGTVVEVGDDKEVIKVQAGQKVMYDKYAGTQIKIDGVEHLILKMADIIAVVE